MHVSVIVRRSVSALAIGALALTTLSPAVVAQTRGGQQQQKPFEPYSGQPGKDVVWVPTPQPLVEKMLDMAKVTPQDLVIDLGSGDGRTVLTAAKRGARAIGVEFNPDMVAHSRKLIAEAKVAADRATIVEGDLFEYDFSKATVVTMFLLPSINMRLRPKILDMRPGTRIVTNSFTMEDWEADETETISGDCVSWCTAHLWIVPAKVAGNWNVNGQTLALTQQFQKLTGRLGTATISDAKLRGEEISFSVGSTKYVGKVAGNSITGTLSGARNGSWTATKQ